MKFKKIPRPKPRKRPRRHKKEFKSKRDQNVQSSMKFHLDELAKLYNRIINFL